MGSLTPGRTANRGVKPEKTERGVTRKSQGDLGNVRHVVAASAPRARGCPGRAGDNQRCQSNFVCCRMLCAVCLFVDSPEHRDQRMTVTLPSLRGVFRTAMLLALALRLAC